MRFEVLLTAHAVGDLEDVVEWVAAHETPGRAAHVLERIEESVKALARFPERGSHPRELLDLGSHDYRQTFFKPYRIIYRIDGRRVYVYLIADGRRDMRSLLERRLLSA
jgi:toxin ParE1/3/4